MEYFSEHSVQVADGNNKVTSQNIIYFRIGTIFYLVFFSRTFTIHRTIGEGGGYHFNLSLPLPPALQTLRYQPSNYCRELTSAHSQHPDSYQESLVSGRKLLTTKLCALTTQLRALSYFHLTVLSNQIKYQGIREN